MFLFIDKFFKYAVNGVNANSWK